VGWIAGKKEYLDTIIKVKSNVDSGMFMPVQRAAIEAFNNTDEWHRLQNAEYTRRREKAWELLDLLDCSYSKDQVGMFIWAKAHASVPDVEEFVEMILQKAHVFLTPGFIFGKKGKRYLRISLCSSRETLDAALERIKKQIGIKTAKV
jgi:LL-diaminopimelate aminotransferase